MVTKMDLFSLKLESKKLRMSFNKLKFSDELAKHEIDFKKFSISENQLKDKFGRLGESQKILSAFFNKQKTQKKAVKQISSNRRVPWIGNLS